MYLYRAIDILGDTVEFFFSENRNLVAAQRFLRKALTRHGRRSATSSTAARPITKQSFPATLKAGCGSDRGDR